MGLPRYRAHGFQISYWPANLDTTVQILKEQLSAETYAQVYPFFAWLIVSIPALFNSAMRCCWRDQPQMHATNPVIPNHNRAAHATSTVLVVDDDPDVLRATGHILQEAGFTVFTGSRAAEVVELTRRHHPTLLLLDVVLADGNGVDVARLVKSDPTLADVFVILVSGTRTSADSQAAGLDEGLADGYIVRPFNKNEFLARIEAFLRLWETQEQLREKNAKLEQLREVLLESEHKYHNIFRFRATR